MPKKKTKFKSTFESLRAAYNRGISKMDLELQALSPLIDKDALLFQLGQAYPEAKDLGEALSNLLAETSTDAGFLNVGSVVLREHRATVKALKRTEEMPDDQVRLFVQNVIKANASVIERTPSGYLAYSNYRNVERQVLSQLGAPPNAIIPNLFKIIDEEMKGMHKDQ